MKTEVEYAVVFRYDNGKKPELIEITKTIDDDDCFDMMPTAREIIRLPEDRDLEGCRLFTGQRNIAGYFICDDKPSEACTQDGDTNHNAWHPRMFGDFALIVEDKEKAEYLVKNATPITWFP